MKRRHFLKTSALAGAAPLFAQEAGRSRFLGITVLPEYIQTEGIDALLKNLIERAGATAVATSPYVMQEADAKTGSREPPADAGAGAVRLLDRPLFGKRELFVTTAPSWSPRAALYQGLRYQPAAPTALTKQAGGVVGDFIREAKAAGLKVYLQVQAAIPPGYRVQFGGPQDEDIPKLPNGAKPAGRVDKNGTLASPHIIAYEHALLRDLVEEHPQIDGFRPDWPEFPPYSLDSWFVDFSTHAEAAAARMGIDFPRMKAEASSLYQRLNGGLTNAAIEREISGGRSLGGFLTATPGTADLFSFKARLVEELLRGLRDVISRHGGAAMELMPNAFPPPWNFISGFDFTRAAPHSNAISTKLYSMHWTMMLRFYGDQLLKANPGLDSKLVAQLLEHWFDLSGGRAQPSVEALHYPEPHEAHVYEPDAMAGKIDRARQQAGSTPVYALAHGYGPMDDYRHRMEIAWKASGGGMWVNRYGYLTDEKLAVLGEVCR